MLFLNVKHGSPPDWLPSYGPPPNMRDVPADHLFGALGSKVPLWFAYKEWQDGKHWFRAKMFGMPGDQGYGYIDRVVNTCVVAPERFFWFGRCDHDMATTTIRMCWHRATCKKCGYTYDYS